MAQLTTVYLRKVNNKKRQAGDIMKPIWSVEVDKILSVGISLIESGINNWVLNRDDTLRAIQQLKALNVAVLGGDVYSINGDLVEPTGDNWFYNKNENESESEYIDNSIMQAANYINNYILIDGHIVGYAIIPDVD